MQAKGIDKPSAGEAHQTKKDIRFSDGISKQKRHKNKHIYFDGDGYETVASNQVFITVFTSILVEEAASGYSCSCLIILFRKYFEFIAFMSILSC